MSAISAANLALKFALEVAAVASLAFWGASLSGTVASAVAMVLAPGVAVVLWGRFAAPRAPRRLSMPNRVPFELGVLLLSAVALLSTGQVLLGLVFAAAIVLNALLLSVLDQWEA